ncbi:MAG: phosphatidylinositol mannoside acyltransferase [Acidimicrobiia bacterium]|nr:phosphatidylinositol mannoside acyltransferase [Acidimicrobiia bacterium]
MRDPVAAYRGLSFAARHLPASLTYSLARAGGWAAPLVLRDAADQVRRNLARVGGSFDQAHPHRAAVRYRDVAATFSSYGRYWVESMRLPGLDGSEIEAGHDVVGYDHVAAARAAGRGVILALPHLGGWEWSGFWLTQVMKVPVTVVAERLEPVELFDFFVEFRRSLGMEIVALGPAAAREVLAALKRNEVVCLLSDRDIQGGGIAVELFGEATTMPAGPAALGLRSGAPVLPVAVYFRRGGVRGVVRPPLDARRSGDGMRADVERMTSQLAGEFEDLIRAAPTQWHLLQPNWPSDPRP